MCTACNTLNTDASEAFAGRMIEIANHGALALMISIGHRTRLFDTMHDLGPASAATLADRAGLHERYVREWLGAMVTGGIVRLDPEAATYDLPAEHAPWRQPHTRSPCACRHGSAFLSIIGLLCLCRCTSRAGL